MDRLDIPKVAFEPFIERRKGFDQKGWDKKHKCRCCGKKTYYKKLADGWICSICYNKKNVI